MVSYVMAILMFFFILILVVFIFVCWVGDLRRR
jgi:hypothetical protein